MIMNISNSGSINIVKVVRKKNNFFVQTSKNNKKSLKVTRYAAVLIFCRKCTITVIGVHTPNIKLFSQSNYIFLQ